MKRPLLLALLLPGIAGLLWLALSLPAQDLPLPQDGLLSPEESVAFIQGLEARGLHGECVLQADGFLRRYPGHPYREQVEMWRIRSLLSLGRTSEASEAIRLHLKDFPQSPSRRELMRCLGRCLQETGNPAEALAVYQELLGSLPQDSPEEEETRYRVAVCLATLGREKEARTELRKLVSRPLDATHLPRVYARQYLAIMRQNEGDSAAALSMHQPLLALKGLPDALRQELLLTAGYLAFLPPVQDYGQALSVYGAFLSEYPEDPRAREVRRNLLSCLYALGKHEEYLQRLQDYRRLYPSQEPQDRELTWLAAQSNMALRRWEEALPLLQQVADDQEASPTRRQQALSSRIYCLEALKRHGETAEEIQRYAQAYPQAQDLEQLLLCRAAALEALGRTEEAIQLYESLLPRLAAGDPAPWQRAALALVKLREAKGEYRQAADLCLELARKAPDTPQGALLGKEFFQETALPILVKIPDDPRALPLVDQLLQGKENREEQMRLLQLRYLFALEAKALPQVEETLLRLLPLCSPAQAPQWLLRKAQVHRLQKRYEDTVKDYQDLLARGETPQEMRRETLPDILALLYYLKRPQEAVPYLEEFFRLSPPEPLSRTLLGHIAGERHARRDFVNAQRALRALLDDRECPPQEKPDLLLRLADAQFQAGQFALCRESLQAVADLRNAQGDLPSVDQLAFQAELAILENRADAALTYAKQALAGRHEAQSTDGRDDVLLPDSLPRATWALARALLDLKAYDEAFSAATQGFILRHHPVYSPRCYLIAAAAKDALGDSKTAQELRQNLQREYPDFSSPAP